MRPLPTLVTILALVAAARGDEAPEFVVVEGDTLWLTPPVEVVGTRAPLSGDGLVRGLTWLGRDDLERRPARSVAGMLAGEPAVDVARRQPDGVQGDLSIRGSTYEQVLVLLDGFAVGDPQTGHHNLNLPLGPGEVGRIEILPGQGSALYGANAVGGVVNVVSRVPGERRGGELEATAGGFGSRGGRVALESGALDAPGGELRLRAGAETYRTDGDHPGTDADRRAASLRAVSEGGGGRLDLLAGAARREFGARDFYAPFPSFERTEALFAGLRWTRPVSRRVILEPRLAFRRHEDHFVLLRDDPQAYVNDHVSRRTTGELKASVDAGHGLGFAFLAGIMAEDLDSAGIRAGAPAPALGDRERRRTTGAAEIIGRHGPVDWSVGGRLDAWRGFDDRGTASAAATVRLAPELVLRGSAGTVYRVPTYTELHYEDPANVADPDLVPETGWTWDAALEARHGPWSFAATLFARFEDDVIDWARPVATPGEPWRSRNIAEAETRGWTQSASLATPAGHRLAVSLTGIRRRTSLPAGWTGKYVSLVPRRQAAAELTLAVPGGVRVTPRIRHRERTDGERHTVADLRVAFARGPWSWRVDATNLFDAAYAEIPGVPMPGRLVTTTVARRF